MAEAVKRAWVMAAALIAASAGCAEDACKSQPASFELEVSASGGVARVLQALVVDVTVDGSTYRKIYALDGKLGDGTTSLGVRVEPAPAATFGVAVAVRGIDADGAVRAEGRATFTASPDGCNRGAVTLGLPGVTDAGTPDAGDGDAAADAGPTPDTAVADDAAPDAGVAADAVGDDATPDATALPDAAPDAATFPDAAAPDASPPDSGGTPFPYPPSNFDPASITSIAPRLQLNCGETTFNSTDGSFGNDCGRATPTMILAPQPGGATAALLAVAGFDILPGSSLRVTGDRPVIIAVFGNATLAGRLDARGRAEAPGAGGNNGADCLTSGGAGPTAGIGGGGGGSFSTAGTNGGAGGGSGGSAGATSGVAQLVPLRGGCSGGRGGGGAGGDSGGGGGAIQVSAAGTLSVPGEVNAGGGGGAGAAVGGGGGGGGSGGGILLEGRSAVVVGTIVSNGGAGGGGGGNSTGGQPGGDGATSPSTGGAGGNNGGLGGNGATRTSLATLGSAGSGPGGGGGGGGGLGRVRINATMCNVGGNISPAHTGCP